MDHLYADYDELPLAERVAACRAARNAAHNWPHRIDESPWTALESGDPRRAAFESKFIELHPRALEAVKSATGKLYELSR